MPENNDWVYFDATCKSCGRTMKDHQPAFLLEMWKKKGEPFPSQCKDCWEAWKKAEEEKDMQAIYDAQLSEEQLDEAVIAAGVAPSYRLKTPPIRFVATSGKTGIRICCYPGRLEPEKARLPEW